MGPAWFSVIGVSNLRHAPSATKRMNPVKFWTQTWIGPGDCAKVLAVIAMPPTVATSGMILMLTSRGQARSDGLPQGPPAAAHDFGPPFP
jgi:hypothetical protein